MAEALETWLGIIADSGWRGAAKAEVTPESRVVLGDRIDALAALQDHVAADAAAGAAEAAGLVRERLFDGLMRGFDALQARRGAVLAIWNSRDPGVALVLAGRAGLHLRRLAMAAGADVSGLRGRARLAALGALCLKAFATWRADDSADMAATMAELDRLLERAERAETEGLSPDLIGLPGLSALVSRLPGRRAAAAIVDPALPPSLDPRAG
jgi:hypothetical protein